MFRGTLGPGLVRHRKNSASPEPALDPSNTGALMRTLSFLVLLLIAPLPLLAGDMVPLNLKPGLWEVTSTHSMTGMPSMPAIPPDTLAKMTPEQRAHVEAMMKSASGAPTTDVNKECVTKEKLEKMTAFDQNKDSGKSNCTHTAIQSTGSRMEMKIRCDSKNKHTSDGTFVIEVLGPESGKGSMHNVITTDTGKTMNMDFSFTFKYLGPACGDVN
jgi:hypothetical protein